MVYIKNSPLSGKNLKERNKFKNLDIKAVSDSLGVAGQDLFESMPQYNQAPCEKVIKGKSDSYIVLGRDRAGNLLQGRGMQGEAKASSIDIVVGRYSGAVPETTPLGDYRYLDPNFQKDSARIYISQKTDIDKNFKIARGKVGNFENRSGIALKADGIRLLAREGIKLVTNIDKFNSKGIEPTNVGIDLIALNDDSDLQPLPKGDNLASALDKLTKHVSDLNKLVTGFLLYQMKMNLAVSKHVHVSPFGGILTSPSQRLTIEGPSIMKDMQSNIDESLGTNRKELEEFKLNFLTKGQKRYINSKYNSTN
tara:strand:- start:2992 stop:3918 length:927 start_codon:yes stop_codon:yes gene_type:complete